MAFNTWTAFNAWAAFTAAVISAVSSVRGADIATGEGLLTITVDDSTGINVVSVNGQACSNVIIVNPTTVTAVCPFAFGAPYGQSGDVVVDNGVASLGHAASLMPPEGMIEDFFTVNHAGLDPNSPYTSYPSIQAGFSAIHDEYSGPDNHQLSMSGDGVYTITPPEITQNQSFRHAVFDITDNTVGTVGIVNIIYVPLTQVVSDLTLRNNILEAVQTDTQLAWNLLVEATSDINVAWHLLNSLTADLHTPWIIRESVDQQVDLSWNVGSSMLSVIADLNMNWMLQESIDAALDTRWELLQSVSSDLSLRHGITDTVIAELQTRHDILNSVSQSAALRWDSLERTQNSLTTNWSLEGTPLSPITIINIKPEKRVYDMRTKQWQF